LNSPDALTLITCGCTAWTATATCAMQVTDSKRIDAIMLEIWSSCEAIIKR
jgi:hypothetical protein